MRDLQNLKSVYTTMSDTKLINVLLTSKLMFSFFFFQKIYLLLCLIVSVESYSIKRNKIKENIEYIEKINFFLTYKNVPIKFKK